MSAHVLRGFMGPEVMIYTIMDRVFKYSIEIWHGFDFLCIRSRITIKYHSCALRQQNDSENILYSLGGMTR